LPTEKAEDEDDGDYVYDVFYYRRQNPEDLELMMAREAALIGRV
jgi:hypothetical protein